MLHSGQPLIVSCCCCCCCCCNGWCCCLDYFLLGVCLLHHHLYLRLLNHVAGHFRVQGSYFLVCEVRGGLVNRPGRKSCCPSCASHHHYHHLAPSLNRPPRILLTTRAMCYQEFRCAHSYKADSCGCRWKVALRMEVTEQTARFANRDGDFWPDPARRIAESRMTVFPDNATLSCRGGALL